MRLVLACLALLALLAPPALAAPQPFELRDGQVVIMVKLKGRELPALLDTGATRSLIETGLAKELGIKTQRVRKGGTVGAGGQKIGIGYSQRAVSIDFGAGPISDRLGTYEPGHAFAPEGVRLLIGMDFLRAMVVSLNFQTMTADIRRSSNFTPPKDAPLELTWSGWGRPTFAVDLAGVRADLILDTAASGALHLDSSFVAATPALKSLPASSRRIVGIDGVREYDSIVISQVIFGGEAFADVRASSGSLGPMHAADDMDGVVGIDLLKRFNLVIDFGYERIWLTPIATSTDS